MITLTRRQARRLRTVFRRSVLGIGQRGLIPPLVLRAEGTQLRAQHRYNGLAIEHTEPGSYRPHEAIALPLDALAECEGRDESPIILEAATADRTVVRWEDRNIPQTREFAVPPLDALASFPDPPPWFEPAPADLFDALAEATATGTDDNTRYALNCLQLKGTTHEIVATDGRQLLVQSGYRFPWDGDVLVRRAPVFASKELARNQAVALGRTDAHVALRAGPWTVYLEVPTDARFPRIDQVLPDARSTTSRLRLDDQDADFLGQVLDRLPGADEPNGPVTVDLNGQIAVRARAADQERATELVLARSRYSGAPVRINANRAFLGRALRLGLREFEIVAADSPVVCRDERRTYAFQPLSQESALGPAEDVIPIESSPPVATTALIRTPVEPPKARTVVSEPTSTPRNDPKRNHMTNGHVGTEVTSSTGLAALIQEVEALHEILSDARTRASRLTVALRKHRRRERLVQTTLASLRQLKLQEVAE